MLAHSRKGLNQFQFRKLWNVLMGPVDVGNSEPRLPLYTLFLSCDLFVPFKLTMMDEITKIPLHLDNLVLSCFFHCF